MVASCSKRVLVFQRSRSGGLALKTIFTLKSTPQCEEARRRLSLVLTFMRARPVSRWFGCFWTRYQIILWRSAVVNRAIQRSDASAPMRPGGLARQEKGGLMYAVRATLIVALLFPSVSIGAEIYGIISDRGRPVQNETVTVNCGREVQSGRSDNYGSYRVFVGTQGSCILSVRGLSAPVRSYARAVRYNFEVRTEGSRIFLERR